jgi:hypothetical protein
MDHRLLLFFLMCRGFEVDCVKLGTELSEGIDYKAVFLCISDKQEANEGIKNLSETYPGAHIFCLTGVYRYSNPHLPPKTKIFEGALDYQSLDMNLKKAVMTES